MNDCPSYNLIDKSWIPVTLVDGTTTSVSLREAFHRAGEIRGYSCELPTMNLPVMRLQLAILRRAIAQDCTEDDPIAIWEEIWNTGRLPLDLVDSYLDHWHEQFDLFDAERPFMQDPNLEATSGKVADSRKLRSASENKPQLFPMALQAKEAIVGQCTAEVPLSMTCGEAARWLLHVHAFDTGGIKTGVKGDPQVKGGKRHGSSPGWLGNVGPVYVEGSNLYETLMYNLHLGNTSSNFDFAFSEGDAPTWERPLEPIGTPHSPKGFADIYTWQSRRVLLKTDDDRVTGVVLTYGDALDYINRQELEPMSAWRRSARLEKDRQEPEVYIPVRHDPQRALWRGLDALLPSIGEGGQGIRMPGILQWLSALVEDPEVSLPLDTVLGVHAVGFIYGTQNACIDEAIDDTLGIPLALLNPKNDALITLAQHCAHVAQESVTSYGRFAYRLARSQGADKDAAKGFSASAEAEAYAMMGQQFEDWLASLNDETDPIVARNGWYDSARHLLRSLASRRVASLGTRALVGRMCDGTWHGAADIERTFINSINKILPRESDGKEA